MTKTIALIVAAGRGNRFGGECPKQYHRLDGKMILTHAIESFTRHPAITHIAVVIHPDDTHLYVQAITDLNTENLLSPINGGATRQESVRLGLEALQTENPDFVLIHDAARPFISNDLLNTIVMTLNKTQGVVPALSLTDSIHKTMDGYATETLNRQNYMRVQTPQAFPHQDILKAHLAFQNETVTDDVALAEKSGFAIKIIEGCEMTHKITTQSDLPECASFPDIRTTQGFDVHRFCEGSHLWLGGVKIPFYKGLSGHSDADVVLHALTDALLGTIAAGDIGVHFPPTDEKWRGADSTIFLKHAARLIAEKKGKILHVDVTIIGEYPKINPHREAIQSSIASLLQLTPDRVSIKATTTERLGFLGRGEGLATQAVATVYL